MVELVNLDTAQHHMSWHGDALPSFIGRQLGAAFVRVLRSTEKEREINADRLRQSKIDISRGIESDIATWRYKESAIERDIERYIYVWRESDMRRERERESDR